MLNFVLSTSFTPVFKTDQFGIEWIRIGVKISQPDQDGNGFVTLSDMDAIYSFTHTLNESNGFDSMLREFVASESQSSQSSEIFIPMITTSSRGGGVKLDNLSITHKSKIEEIIKLLRHLDMIPHLHGSVIKKDFTQAGKYMKSRLLTKYKRLLAQPFPQPNYDFHLLLEMLSLFMIRILGFLN